MLRERNPLRAWSQALRDFGPRRARSSGVALTPRAWQRPPGSIPAQVTFDGTGAAVDSGVVLRRERDSRPVLRRRVSTWAGLGTLLCTLTGCSSLLLLWIGLSNASWLRQVGLVQLSGAMLFGGIGLYLLHASRSEAVPKVVDAVLAASGALIVLGSTWHVPRELRPDLIAILAIGQMLVARAAFVPSAPRRTLLIGIGCAGALVPFTYAYFASRVVPGFGPAAWVYTLVTTAFAACIVGVAGAVARSVQRMPDSAKAAPRLGQYSLMQKIGGGGMGVVYKAEHTTLLRPTAIKVLPPEKLGEQNLVRFEREARMTAQLCHPNTVSVYDYGRTPGGTLYYAMEYIEGIDLDLLVQHDGPQHPGRVIQILSQICGSLGEAHAMGLVHRDIKPSNIFLCERAGMVDVVKVLDFGLVKSFGSEAEQARARASVPPSDGPRQEVTRPDVATRQHFLGTPHYISPEAILGTGDIDGRIDIYALGCVAHYLLTGAPPFSGNTVLEVLGQHLHATPKSFAEQSPWSVSPELEQVVLSCLGKSRVNRPSDAATLSALLQQCPDAAAWDQEHGRQWWVERGAPLQASLVATRDADMAAPAEALDQLASA
jgi:hypothetical protein